MDCRGVDRPGDDGRTDCGVSDLPALSVSFAAAGPAATTPGAKSCSPRLQAYFAADFKDADYQKRAFQKIASAWKRPKESPRPARRRW